MPRKKVRMGFIENTSRRKVSYKTRVECLMKKAKELSTLCGFMVCSIVYGPFEPEPKVWTTTGSTVGGVYAALRRYYQQKQTGKLRKMANQVSFVREIINKVDEQVKKQQCLNHGALITDLMLRCMDSKNNNNNNYYNSNLEEMSLTNLIALEQKVNRQLSDVDKKIMELSAPAPPPEEPVVFPSWLISWINESSDDYDFVPFGGQVVPNLHLHQDDL